MDYRGHNENRRSLHGDDASSVATGRLVRGGVRRYELALPAGTYAGVPGYPDLGGGARINAGGGFITVVNSIEQALVQPVLPLAQSISGAGAVRAIAIAPDSPIDCCDLWFGDFKTADRFRISPGHPFIGDITDADHVWVTLPEPIGDPFDADDEAGEAAGTWSTENHVWDAQLSASAGVGVGSARAEFAFPLRLEVYRGELPPFSIARRAPYLADAGFDNRAAGGGALAYGKLWTIVQGRVRHMVTAHNFSTAAEDCIVTVTAYRPVINRQVVGQTRAIQRRLVSRMLDQFTLAAGQARTLDYDVRAQWLAVTVAPGGPSKTDFHATAHVRSEDV